MSDYLNINRELWQKLTGVHANSEFYRLAHFKEGENALHPLERTEVGSVSGKSLLHLQCHFGMDSLSWASLGADVVGVDFSTKAIELARALSDELHLPARFVCCDLYDLPNHLNRQFDIVFTSYGVLTWLPDVARWAQIAASYVKPGGFFYIVEHHPFAQIFDEEARGFSIKYPYFHEGPFTGIVDRSYAGAAEQIEPSESYEWDHPLGEVITALIQAGLQIEFVHEFPYSVYQQLADLKETDEHTFIFDEKEALFPLMYSIRAKKI
jgi:SAM-dependent methyltransferase